MRLLCVHNHYQQRGGEDGIFEDEVALLRRHGHEVVCYTRHNDDVNGMNRLALAGRTIWSRASTRALDELIARERPDVLHLYNTFPLVSPAAAWAGRRAGVPVIQTVQNYRLACPNAQLLRDGRVCLDCLGRGVAWPALRHACYRQDRAATAVVTLMQAAHRLARTWHDAVDLFIVPSDWTAEILIRGGLPAARVAVKPNFVVEDPGFGGDGDERQHALFVGRLAPEKGIETLLEAWSCLEGRIPLKIAGDGPLAGLVREAAARDSRIEWLGWQPREAVLALMGAAKTLVFPSLWFEAMPRTILEAFATGTPVVSSNLGAMRTLVEDGGTGLHFEPGVARELAARVAWAFEHPDELAAMGHRARRQYERAYTAEHNYGLLLEIYRQAIGQVEARDAGAALVAVD